MTANRRAAATARVAPLILLLTIAYPCLATARERSGIARPSGNSAESRNLLLVLLA